MLEAKYRIKISEAWERLGLGTIPGPVVQKLDSFSKDSEEVCAETFSLHIEVQLVMHYDERGALQPIFSTLDAVRRLACFVKPFFAHCRVQLPHVEDMVFVILPRLYQKQSPVI
jgi:hypothetical protein